MLTGSILTVVDRRTQGRTMTLIDDDGPITVPAGPRNGGGTSRGRPMTLIDDDGRIPVRGGLRTVVVTSPGIGDVRGGEGFYHYRQYSAVDLARTRDFTDVCALLIDGALPDRAGAARFAAEIAPLRRLPDAVRDVLPAIAAAGGSPLTGLRTALSLTGAALDLPPLWDADPATRRADALRVCALTPTIPAALHRLRRGLHPPDPRPHLSPPPDRLWAG